MLSKWNPERVVTPEKMDMPGIDATAHRQALAGLRRINALSGATARIAAPIVAWARQEGIGTLSLADVACGGGDVSIGVAERLRQAGVAVSLHLLDISPTALDHASKRARRAGFDCQTWEAPALQTLAKLQVDVVINSLFLHHMPGRSETVAMLHGMAHAAKRMGVISDLRRCRMGHVAAVVGCHVLSRSPIVHYDGPVSVQAAWTEGELREMAAEAGLVNAKIVRSRPWRLLLTWYKSESAR